MRVYRGLEAYRAAPAGPGAVVTIGNFDGVHLAHQRLLAAARNEARAAGLASLALTFEPHPSRILHPASAPPLITPGAEKLRWLEASGITAAVLLPFDRDLSLLSPREFASQVLAAGLGARAVHEGANFRFGHRHQGDVAALESLGREFGFAVRLHPQVVVRGAPVSSSRIRSAVAAGDLGLARHLLGRVFQVSGPLARGRGVGRQRTVPTLNLEHYDELLPARGVYLTRLQLRGLCYDAVTNVGVRPTFGEPGPLTVESHILHPPENLDPGPGEPLTLAFLRRLRDELRFESPEALRARIQLDIAFARRYFSRLPPPPQP